jgi:hypothetical protein
MGEDYTRNTKNSSGRLAAVTNVQYQYNYLLVSNAMSMISKNKDQPYNVIRSDASNHSMTLRSTILHVVGCLPLTSVSLSLRNFASDS